MGEDGEVVVLFPDGTAVGCADVTGISNGIIAYRSVNRCFAAGNNDRIVMVD